MFVETNSETLSVAAQGFTKKLYAPFRITDRDLDIIDFLLHMKFSGFEELYLKFFPSPNALGGRTYSHWSRDRIGQLRRQKLIQAFHFPGSIKRYFLATDKGRRLLIRERPHLNPPWALKKPQYLHFEHDLLVLRTRLFLETKKQLLGWVSERTLSIECSQNQNQRAEKQNIPDGVYINSEGKRVAVEVEITQKNQRRYADKVKFLFAQMKTKSFPLFEWEQVIFICKSRAVAKRLTELTKMLGDSFAIYTFEEFFQLPTQST